MLRFPALDISHLFPLLSGLIHSCSCESSTGRMYVSSPNFSSDLEAHMPNFLLDSPLNFSRSRLNSLFHYIPISVNAASSFQPKPRRLSCSFSYSVHQLVLVYLPSSPSTSLPPSTLVWAINLFTKILYKHFLSNLLISSVFWIQQPEESF